ncbi:MAG: nuclear transport factor 2 family protein [Nocardioidaceae bacterium]
MTAETPEPLRGFIEAVNDGDTDAFLSYFPDDGLVDDWGRKFRGHDAIRDWSDKEFVGAEGTLTVNEVTVSGSEITVDGHWASSHFTGPSRFVFRVDGETVREMRITDG